VVQTIRNLTCAVVRLDDIEDAEELCRTWDEYEFSKTNRLKVDIHPYSYRKRPVHKLSFHPIFKEIY
jgi:hypothetical protein